MAAMEETPLPFRLSLPIAGLMALIASPVAAQTLCVDAGATDRSTLERIATELGKIPGVRTDCEAFDVRFFLFVEPVAASDGTVLGWQAALTYRTAEMDPLELNLRTYTGPAYDDVFLPAFLRVAVEVIMPRLRQP